MSASGLLKPLPHALELFEEAAREKVFVLHKLSVWPKIVEQAARTGVGHLPWGDKERDDAIRRILLELSDMKKLLQALSTGSTSTSRSAPGTPLSVAKGQNVSRTSHASLNEETKQALCSKMAETNSILKVCDQHSVIMIEYTLIMNMRYCNCFFHVFWRCVI